MQLSYQASLPSTIPESSKAVVLIHIVERQDETNKLENFRDKFAKDRWYVAPRANIVMLPKKSCDEYSSVRFFNTGDSSLAKDLMKKVNEILESLNKGKNNHEYFQVEKINNEEGVQDLSKWKYTDSVPAKTLELWLKVNDEQCENQGK